MSLQNVFYAKSNRLRVVWRILIFIFILLLTLSPLLLINNSNLQFTGALIILLTGLYLNSKYLDKRDFSQYGLILRKTFFTDLLVGVLIGVFSVFLILLIGETTGILFVSEFIELPETILLLAFAYKMLLVSTLEETFFRGYLFTNFFDGLKSKHLSQSQALIISIMLSSTIFGIAHFSNNNSSLLSMALLTINGIVWCIPFVITKNLGLSIGLHMAWNFTQTQLGFTMSGNQSLKSIYKIENIGSDILTGGTYGPEAGIIGLIGFAFMLLMSLAYLKLKGNKNVIKHWL